MLTSILVGLRAPSVRDSIMITRNLAAAQKSFNPIHHLFPDLPKVPFAGTSGSNCTPGPGCLSFVSGNLVPSTSSQRNFAEKSDDPKGPAKEESMDVKMPGFVHPDTMNEEGYFTQKAKKQLEELKKKIDKPSLDNPEKKE